MSEVVVYKSNPSDESRQALEMLSFWKSKSGRKQLRHEYLTGDVDSVK